MEVEPRSAEPEEISDAFVCCVCLDLLYKPIVLACGHISCFWCVHRSMSSYRESHCPICRDPYHYFPTICQLLHFLLLKIYPVAYKRREDQILEEEKKLGSFSPKVEDLLCVTTCNEELNCPHHQKESSSASNYEQLPANIPIRTRESCTEMEQGESVAFIEVESSCISKQITIENSEMTDTVGTEERCVGQICRPVSIVDVLCPACKQLLYRPAVLNCGHVYCESCIGATEEGIRCQHCRSLHPQRFPKVCLELDHFLEEQFMNEYAGRRVSCQLKQVQFQSESPPTCCTKVDTQSVQQPVATEEDLFHSWDDGLMVHIHVGCDYCGMYPIIGDRYKCRDCKEAMGFDLCGECYKSSSKLPGRFNQQHTPDHRLVLVNVRAINVETAAGSFRSWISRAIFGGDDAENAISSSSSAAETTPQNSENVVLGVTSTSSSTSDDNEDNQSEDSHSIL